MTAIAFRSGQMAADTRTTHNYVKANEVKIIHRDGYLIGVSGESCPSNADLVRWFFNAIDKHQRPEFKDYKFTLLVATPKGRITTIDNSGRFYPIVHQRFWAVGAGSEVCMGAMEMGATAEQAVRAAIKWQKDCGGRVTVRSLKSSKGKHG
jgi:20S proteasome alpha/beta subunit